MEDAVDSALTVRHAEAAERSLRLRELKRASDRIAKLINIALALDS